MALEISLEDKTEATVKVVGISQSGGIVSVTTQKYLKDIDTKEDLPDGDSVTVVLSDADVAALEAAQSDVLTPIVKAINAGTYGQTAEAAPAAENTGDTQSTDAAPAADAEKA